MTLNNAENCPLRAWRHRSELTTEQVEICLAWPSGRLVELESKPHQEIPLRVVSKLADLYKVPDEVILGELMSFRTRPILH